MSEIIIWVVMVAIALILLRATRLETIYDSPRRGGYIIMNDLMGNPALDGRLFYTRQGAERWARRIAKDVPWVQFSVRRVV